MGATLDLFIEYDDSEFNPFTMDIDGVIDFSKSQNITHCKPYQLMQAIAGVRGNPDVKPLINPRGFPAKVNHKVEEYIDELYGLDYHCAGWLLYSELKECLRAANLKTEELNDSIQMVIQIFKMISEKYGNSRARLIFAVDSP